MQISQITWLNRKRNNVVTDNKQHTGFINRVLSQLCHTSLNFCSQIPHHKGQVWNNDEGAHDNVLADILTAHLKDSNSRVWNMRGMATGKVKSQCSQKNLLGATLTNRDPTQTVPGLYPHTQWETCLTNPEWWEIKIISSILCNFSIEMKA
jgi:hypothetical protein